MGVLRKFDNANQILGEFYGVRLEYYHKRKAFLEGMLGADAQKLSNQARFIIEKCEGSLVVENKKKKVMIAELQRKGFDPDPVKRWKKTQEEEAVSETESDSDADLGEEAKHEVNSSPASDMSNSIETAIAIASFDTIAIGIAKAIPKLLLIASYFYIEVSASQTGLEGHTKDLCGLKQSNNHPRVSL